MFEIVVGRIVSVVAVRLSLAGIFLGFGAVVFNLAPYQQCGSDVGQVAQALSTTTEDQCQAATTHFIGGWVIGAIGVLLMVLGVVVAISTDRTARERGRAKRRGGLST